MKLISLYGHVYMSLDNVPTGMQTGCISQLQASRQKMIALSGDRDGTIPSAAE